MGEIYTFNNFISALVSNSSSKERISGNLSDLRSICNSYIHTCRIFKLEEDTINKVEEQIDDIVKNIGFIIETSKNLSASETESLCEKIKTYEPLDTIFGRTTLLVIDCSLLILEETQHSLSSNINPNLERSPNDINNLMWEIDDIMNEIDNTLEDTSPSNQYDDYVLPTEEELENDLKNIMEDLLEEPTNTLPSNKALEPCNQTNKEVK